MNVKLQHLGVWAFLKLHKFCVIYAITKVHETGYLHEYLLFPTQRCGARIAQYHTATDYGLGSRGSIAGRGKRFFSSPLRPDRFWGTPSLLSNGHRGFFPRG
jgi:hypothetical protein